MPLVLLLPVLVLLLPLLLAGSARAAEPAVTVASGPGAQPAPGSRVAVLVDRLEPAAPQRTDTVEVAGTVLNRAAEQFDEVQISLHVGRPVGSRSALAEQRADPVAQPLASIPARLGDGRLQPGARVPFSLSAPAATLLTAGRGVYPLQVTVVGRTTEGLRDLGSADTFLPYVPVGTGQPAPLPVAWILPLTDRPRLAASGGVSDDELTASLSDGGRLADILTAATNLPAATVTVDPALLRAVSVVATGRYPVGLTSVTASRPADGDARVWLQRLSAVTGTGGRTDVVPIAFADADVESLLHSGRTELARQVLSRGTGVMREVLGASGDTRLAVPAAGRLDTAGAAFARSTGATTALLDPEASETGSSAWGTVSTGSGTSNGTTPGTPDNPNGPSGNGELNTVVPDQPLRQLLLAGPTAEPSPRLAEQSVLAELAQAYLTPATPGAPLVLAPGSGWAPSADWAAHLAALTADHPWLRPIGLSDLLSDTARRAVPTQLRYTDADRAAELSPSLVAPVTDTLAAVNGFAEALPKRQNVTRTVTDTALTALSASFRTDPQGSTDRRTSAENGLAALRGSVRAVASREVTLTSRNGRIPVTLENNLSETVNVTMRLTSLDRSRVQSDTSVSRVIQPGQKVQVEVTVRATSAGTFPVRLVLLTPTGRPLGPPQQVLLRSTAAGVVAKGVTIAALAVLMLTVLGRGIRGLIRRRRSGPPRPGQPGGSTGTPTDSTSSVPA